MVTTDPVLSTIDSWNENLEQMQDGMLKTCPTCKEEWSSLRPCQYLSDNGRNVVTNVCVRCAETLVAFEQIAARTPLEGVFVEIKWSGPKEIGVQIGNRIEFMKRPKNAYAVISYGTTRFIATSNGTGTPIQFKQEGASQHQYANNVFALWSMIKNQIQNPRDIIDDLSADRIKTARSDHHYAA